jgi:hypothetical protein
LLTCSAITRIYRTSRVRRNYRSLGLSNLVLIAFVCASGLITPETALSCKRREPKWFASVFRTAPSLSRMDALRPRKDNLLFSHDNPANGGEMGYLASRNYRPTSPPSGFTLLDVSGPCFFLLLQFLDITSLCTIFPPFTKKEEISYFLL